LLPTSVITGPVRLAAIDAAELTEFVVDAWHMVVPKRLGASYDGQAAGRHQE
jgi:hypothetical protein